MITNPLRIKGLIKSKGILLSFLLLMAGYLQSQAQIRLTQVDPVANQFTVTNFGADTVDVSTYRWCSEFAYTPNPLSAMTLVSGSLNLIPGASVTIGGITFDDVAADFGLYLPSGGFGNAASMVDFVQWGSSPNGRESVAVTKGIWSAGTFLGASAPYTYVGEGSENGVSAWRNATSSDYVAVLSGNQEVLPVLTTGKGNILAILDDADSSLTVSGAFSNLSSDFNPAVGGTGAHIHLGYAGQNGGIQLALKPALDADLRGGIFASDSNTFILNDTQFDAFKARKMYVNLHTLGFGSGEIRGQLLPQADAHYGNNLFSSYEVPSQISNAQGGIVVELVGDQIIVTGSFSGLESDFNPVAGTGAHLHSGIAGQGGGVEVALSPTINAGNRSGFFEAGANTFTLSADQMALLKGRQLYANIHSTNFGGGELRGQVHGLAHAVFRAHLSGANENPPVTTEAGGQVLLELIDTTLVVSGSFQNLESTFTANHIHQAIAGTNGGVVVALNSDLDTSLTSGVFPSDSNSFSLDSAQIAALYQRKMYVNVHSSGNPGGEIRGQALPEGPYFLNGNLSGTQEVTPAATSASGAVKAEVRGNRLVVSGSFSGLGSDLNEAIQGGSHLHLAVAGSNGGIAFPLNVDLGTDNRSGVYEADSNTFTITTGLRDTLVNRGFYVNIHSVDIGSGELRAQLLPEALAYFVASLSGTSETSPVNSAGFGTAIAELRGSSVTISGSFSGLDSDFNTSIAGGAHIHAGFAGQNGGIIDSLTTNIGVDMRSGVFEADSNTFALGAGESSGLRTRSVYVNVHSLDVPSGEIRGNFLPLSTRYFTTSLSAKNEVQPKSSPGLGGLKLELRGSKLTVTGAFSGLTAALNTAVGGTGAHLHLGEVGSNGGIQISLTPTLTGDSTSGFFTADSNQFDLDSAQLADISSASYYANLHSLAIGSGELRGQILPEANFYPSDTSQITSPASGAFVEITGDSATAFTATWSASSDENPLGYIWQLSDTSDFSRFLVNASTGADAMFTTDFKTVDMILADNGVGEGDTLKVYHRAISTDGAVCLTGSLDSVNLVRGMLTSIDPAFADQFRMTTYPSPTDGKVNLRIASDLNERLNMELRDLSGRVILQKEIQVHVGEQLEMLDLSKFAPGLYFIQLSTQGRKLYPQKIWKQ